MSFDQQQRGFNSPAAQSNVNRKRVDFKNKNRWGRIFVVRYIKIYKYNSSWKKLKVSGPFSSEFCSRFFFFSPPRSQLLPLLLLWKINSWSVVTSMRTAHRRGLWEPSQPMKLRPWLWLTVTNARDPSRERQDQAEHSMLRSVTQ